MFKTLYEILKKNPYAKGNFQYELSKAILKTGTITIDEAKIVLHKANPERKVSFFTGHRVFEVLTKKGVIYESPKNSGVLVMPYYDELSAAQIKKLRSLASREGAKFEESCK